MNILENYRGDGLPPPAPMRDPATAALLLEDKLHAFKFYFLDRNDVVVTVRDFGATNDQTALDEGEKFRRGHTIEICCGERRVGRLDKLATPRIRPLKAMAAL